MARQETAPAVLGGDSDNLPSAAARAAEFLKESHVASAISTVQPPKNYVPQASRNAPPRPPISSSRPAPGPPGLPSKTDATPQTSELQSRTKAHGPLANIVPERTESEQARQQERMEHFRQQEKLRLQEMQRLQEERWERQQEEKQRHLQKQLQLQHEQQLRSEQQHQPPAPSEPARPQLPPSKSSPATAPAPGPAGATAGPPPVLPLQPAKKVQIQHLEKPPKLAPPPGGVAAAAAALEKPKEKEKRISTMTEVQIMEKLRQVVSEDDPKLLYSKIKKVGQG